MKKSQLLLMLTLVACAATAHAELYKSVGPDGKITYSDTPPPPSAKVLEKKAVTDNTVDSSGLPYDLAQAVKGNPVTLYTSAKCQPCEDARKLLNSRGIPFSEKIVSSNNDLLLLRQVSGDNQLPVIVVGRMKQKGYEINGWNTALTAAGYPETSKLPKTYHNPPAESATPAAAAKADDKQQATDNAASASGNTPPAASGNAPPGFRF